MLLVWEIKQTECTFKEYYEFCDLEYNEVIKFISTCWLCLELCVNRELKKYIGLESYFQSENFADKRFKRLQAAFNNPMTEIYLYFYQAMLPCFTNFNKLLQRKEPLIYKLYEAQQRFMSKLASRLIKPLSIQNRKESSSSLATFPDDTKKSQRYPKDVLFLVSKTS